MSPKKSQKAVYLRAHAAVLRSFGVSVRETAKILQKSKSWVAKWSSSQYFSEKPRNGRPTVLDRNGQKIIKKVKYKRGRSTRKISKQPKNKDLPGSIAASSIQSACVVTCKRERKNTRVADVAFLRRRCIGQTETVRKL